MIKYIKYIKVYIYILVIIGFFLLTLNYLFNLFHIVDQQWFENWQLDSEWCVWQRVYDDIYLGFRHHYGLLGEWFKVPGEYSINHKAYTGQIGIQGFFLGLIYRAFSLKDYFTGRFLAVILFCSCIFYFLYWLKKEFGVLSSIITYILLFLING